MQTLLAEKYYKSKRTSKRHVLLRFRTLSDDDDDDDDDDKVVMDVCRPGIWARGKMRVVEGGFLCHFNKAFLVYLEKEMNGKDGNHSFIDLDKKLSI